MLEKTATSVTELVEIGRVCVERAPVRVIPTPPPITVPRPPGFGGSVQGSTQPDIIKVYYQRDEFGYCWKITQWYFGSALQPKIEKTPIDCNSVPGLAAT